MTATPLRRRARWGARFDNGSLVAPVLADDPALDATAQSDVQRLRAWCLAGSGPACSPPWVPWVPPSLDTPLAITDLACEPASATAIATRLMLDLDGSLRLAEMGRLGGIGLKLQTLLRDGLWWRAQQASDPWDCGTLREGDANWQALRAFTPRRPTLIVASGLTATALDSVVAVLQEREATFARAVRLLVIGPLPSSMHDKLR